MALLLNEAWFEWFIIWFIKDDIKTANQTLHYKYLIVIVLDIERIIPSYNFITVNVSSKQPPQSKQKTLIEIENLKSSEKCSLLF